VFLKLWALVKLKAIKLQVTLEFYNGHSYILHYSVFLKFGYNFVMFVIYS